MYRYILRESCTQFDSLPRTSLTIPLFAHRFYSRRSLISTTSTTSTSAANRNRAAQSPAKRFAKQLAAGRELIAEAEAATAHGAPEALELCRCVTELYTKLREAGCAVPSEMRRALALEHRACLASGDVAGAIQVGQQLIILHFTTFAPDAHPVVGLSCYTQGQLMVESGTRVHEGESWLRQALAVLTVTHGATHSLVEGLVAYMEERRIPLTVEALCQSSR